MWQVLVEPEPVLIEKALEEVLAGSAFRSSRQCQALLRYIVEHTMGHRYEMLRERVIGANVFGRARDYDTGNDPVVRARAAELRKRLAQHYLRHDDAREAVRIEIPSGSYRAVFEMQDVGGLGRTHPEPGSKSATSGIVSAEAAPGDSADHRFEAPLWADDSAAEPVTRSRVMKSQGVRPRWRKWAAGAGLAALVLLAAGMLSMRQIRSQPLSMSDRFWAPITKSQHPVLIFIGANHAYWFKDDFLNSYRAKHHMEDTGREFFIDLKQGDMIDESELKPTEQLIGFGDVAAAARMASMLTKLDKRYDLRYGNDIGVTDLQSSPTILIGGFSNVWTLEVMHQLRFRLERGDRIVDEKDQTRVWIRRSDRETFTGDDYAVISRLVRSETGNFVVAIAGIDTYSNQAAADLLNDPDRLGAMLKTLPQGWEQKNMQIVLHTSVVKDVPASVNVEAVEVR